MRRRQQRRSGWGFSERSASSLDDRQLSRIASSTRPVLELPLSPLLGLAEDEKRLRIDAVVLHGIRGGLALHDVLEGLHVGDLGDERGLVGPVWVPERPNGDA